MISRAKILETITPAKFKAIRSGVDPREIENSIDDYSPFENNDVILLQIGNDPEDLIVIGIEDGVEKIALPGEKHLYSYNIDSEVLASILLNQDSEIVLNKGEDFAVRFSSLETAYNELQNKFNDLVDIFNAHIHATTATIGLSPIGVLSATGTPGAPSTGDISASKVLKVRIP